MGCGTSRTDRKPDFKLANMHFEEVKRTSLRDVEIEGFNNNEKCSNQNLNYEGKLMRDKKDTEPLLRKTVGSVASTIKAKDSMMKPIRGVLRENKNVMEASKMNENIPEENIMKDTTAKDANIRKTVATVNSTLKAKNTMLKQVRVSSMEDTNSSKILNMDEEVNKEEIVKDPSRKRVHETIRATLNAKQKIKKLNENQRNKCANENEIPMSEGDSEELCDQNRKPVLETVNAVISARHQIKKINTSRMSINKAKQLTSEDRPDLQNPAKSGLAKKAEEIKIIVTSEENNKILSSNDVASIDMKDPNLSSAAGSIQSAFRARLAKKDKAAKIIQKAFKKYLIKKQIRRKL